MQAEFIKNILELTSSIDNKVRLEFQKGQSQGQWSSIVFNGYCYEKSGSSEAGNRRSLAMVELFGRAAALCYQHDPTGAKVQMRSYYKDANGTLKPKLFISILPEATASAPAATVDYGAKVEAATRALIAKNFDFSKMPASLRGDAMIAAWLATELAKLEDATAPVTEAPAIDSPDEPNI